MPRFGDGGVLREGQLRAGSEVEVKLANLRHMGNFGDLRA